MTGEARPTVRPAVALLLVVLLLSAGLAGCGRGDDRRTLTVFAAASLTGTFTVLGERFEQAHPDVEVRLSFAGSSDLATQVLEGAPADVFAAADAAQAQRVLDAGEVAGAPVAFATNVLQLVVPPGNPAGVRTLDDLDGAGVDLVVCAPQVPCGAAALRLAARAGIELRPVSEEASVTGVLDKVRTGQADVGLAYVTDVQAAGGAVAGVDVAGADEVVNRYEAVVTADAGAHDLAEAFVDLVVSADGQRVLADAGFGPPGP